MKVTHLLPKLSKRASSPFAEHEQPAAIADVQGERPDLVAVRFRDRAAAGEFRHRLTHLVCRSHEGSILTVPRPQFQTTEGATP